MTGADKRKPSSEPKSACEAANSPSSALLCDGVATGRGGLHFGDESLPTTSPTSALKPSFNSDPSRERAVSSTPSGGGAGGPSGVAGTEPGGGGLARIGTVGAAGFFMAADGSRHYEAPCEAPRTPADSPASPNAVSNTESKTQPVVA